MDGRRGNERTVGELYGDKEDFPVDKRYRAAVQLDVERHNLRMDSTRIESARANDKFTSDHETKIKYSHRIGFMNEVRASTSPVLHPHSDPIITHKHPLSGAPWSGMSTRISSLPSEAVTAIHNFGIPDEMHRMGNSLAIATGHRPLQGLDCHVQPPQQRYHQDWQQFYAQHRQWMFPQPQHDPYITHSGLVSTQTTRLLHPVVFIPVPLPIAKEVAQYVNEYTLLEQQQSRALHEAKHLHLKHPDQSRAPHCIDSIPDAVVVESTELLVSASRLEPDEIRHSEEEYVNDDDSDEVEGVVGSNRPEEVESRPFCDHNTSSIPASLSPEKSTQPACQDLSLSTETLDLHEQSRQNENQVQHPRDTVEGQSPPEQRTMFASADLHPHTVALVAATPEQAAMGVRAKKPGMKNKKRVRKSRKRVSAAEEARLAASHPASPYTTTIGSCISCSATEAWRQQVRYHWYGTLLFDPERCVQVWRGAWLGLKHAAAQNFSVIRGPSGSTRAGELKQHLEVPTIEAFAATETTFEYVSRKIRKHNLPQFSQDCPVVPQTGYFKGYFKMRSTKVKAYVKHPDHDFYIVFEPYAPGKDGLVHEYALYGRGMGEYGAFIVHGRYSNQTGLMQAVRVYLTESDDRAKMTLKQLQAWFQQGGSI